MQIHTIEKPIKEEKDFVKLIESGNYFKEMDYAILNSPTATMAVLMFKKYCELQNLKREYLDLWSKIIDEKFKYGMFTLWIEYDVDLNVKNAHFRLSKNYRAKKMDDVGNVSTYLNVITGKKFPAFNKNKEVLKKQIDEAGGFDKFSGQIYQYNTTSQPYELSPLASVLKWMKIEEDTPNHVSASADNALFGNNIFLMKGGVDSSNDDETNLDATNTPKKISNTERVLNALKSAKGSKQSGTNFVLSVEADSDEDLTKAFVKIGIGNEIDIDKFNEVDAKASEKICIAAYCFPRLLCNPSEGLFGNSGEAINGAINYWKSTCLFEAEKIEKEFLRIGIQLQDVQPITVTP